MSMPKSCCKYCIEGVVFSPDCERIISNRFCELDEWDTDTRCTPDGCHYYTRKRKEGGAE